MSTLSHIEEERNGILVIGKVPLNSSSDIFGLTCKIIQMHGAILRCLTDMWVFFNICSKNFKLQVGVALNGHLNANFKIVQVSSLAFCWLLGHVTVGTWCVHNVKPLMPLVGEIAQSATTQQHKINKTKHDLPHFIYTHSMHRWLAPLQLKTTSSFPRE